MIMYSFYLLGIGINEYMCNIPKKKKRIIDWDNPKKIWLNDIEDFRFYEKHKN
jgi:hypothetical protein